MIFIEENQVSNQDHAQKVQDILDAIDKFKNVERYNYEESYKTGINNETEEFQKNYNQFKMKLKNFNGKFKFDDIKRILGDMNSTDLCLTAELLPIIFDKCPDKILDSELAENLLGVCDCKIFNIKLLNVFLKKLANNARFSKNTMAYLFDVYGERNLTVELLKKIIERRSNDCTLGKSVSNLICCCKPKILDADLIIKILNMCVKNTYVSIPNYPADSLFSLSSMECLQFFYLYCNKEIFIEENKIRILTDLNQDKKEFFQSLCEFHKEEGKKRNKKLEVFGIVGVTIGGLSGLVAIGLGAAVGVGALAVTIVAPIISAVVSLVLIAIFSYLVDKFRVNKVLNKIAEAKLNGKVIVENEIPFDLRHRKKIQDALDESKDPLLQDAENEIVQ